MIRGIRDTIFFIIPSVRNDHPLSLAEIDSRKIELRYPPMTLLFSHPQKEPLNLDGPAYREQSLEYFRSQADEVFQDQKGLLKTDLSGNQMRHLHSCSFRRRYSSGKVLSRSRKRSTHFLGTSLIHSIKFKVVHDLSESISVQYGKNCLLELHSLLASCSFDIFISSLTRFFQPSVR